MWMTLFLVSDVFFLATASSRPRHDWILEYAPPFLIIIIFFFLHHTFDKHLIRYPTLALATRHDTIRYIFFSFFFFFLSFWNLKTGNFEHPLKGTDEKGGGGFGWQGGGGGRKKPKQIDITYIHGRKVQSSFRLVT